MMNGRSAAESDRPAAAASARPTRSSQPAKRIAPWPVLSHNNKNAHNVGLVFLPSFTEFFFVIVVASSFNRVLSNITGF